MTCSFDRLLVNPTVHLDHPLKIGFIQLIVYLQDVDISTHSFAISPQAVDETFAVLSKEVCILLHFLELLIQNIWDLPLTLSSF